MGFFNFLERQPKSETELKQEAEESWKDRVKKIFEMRKHISMDPVPADRPIQDKIDLEEANLIDEMGREKYNALLEEVKAEFGQDAKSV